MCSLLHRAQFAWFSALGYIVNSIDMSFLFAAPHIPLTAQLKRDDAS